MVSFSLNIIEYFIHYEHQRVERVVECQLQLYSLARAFLMSGHSPRLLHLYTGKRGSFPAQAEAWWNFWHVCQMGIFFLLKLQQKQERRPRI